MVVHPHLDSPFMPDTAAAAALIDHACDLFEETLESGDAQTF
tara:strand:- start:362 stop:487 length:126 start_codon:yes stop_codon:yes gene_type:complete